MTPHTPLHPPHHARIDHEAVHRATLRIAATRPTRPRRQARRRRLRTRPVGP